MIDFKSRILTLRRQGAKLHNKEFDPPHKLDSPKRCLFGEEYWNQYPIKNYNYQYNLWGLRGEDYAQYQYTETPVNICIGDSNTLNVGGPVEHSWPNLLSKLTGIPSINISMDGMCFYDFNHMLDRFKKFFQVNQVFVLYNLFEYDEEPVDNLLFWNGGSNIDVKSKILKEHCWIQDAYWQFDPPWQYSEYELPWLYKNFPEAHNYLKGIKINVDNIDLSLLLTIPEPRVKYLELSGTSWMQYEKFCELCLRGVNVIDYFSADIDKKLIKDFILSSFYPTLKKMLLTNRDGWHMSKLANMELAKYFYDQSRSRLLLT